MSLAQDPVWSNNDKTVTIKMKTNYVWSDGQPVTSKDTEFWIDELAAGVKESPANWGPYVPGLGLPDQVTSMSTPDNSTLVINLNKAVNPTWFWQDALGAIQPMPSHAWAKSSASGPMLDFTNQANATAIYNFLAAQSKSVSTYATNPLWQVVNGPYKLTAFDATNGSLTMSPNTTYGGPHASPQSTASFVSSSVRRFWTFIATRGVALARTSLKLSRSMFTAFRSLSGRIGVAGWPDRSARTPTTNGSSFFTVAPSVSTS